MVDELNRLFNVSSDNTSKYLNGKISSLIYRSNNAYLHNAMSKCFDRINILAQDENA